MEFGKPLQAGDNSISAKAYNDMRATVIRLSGGTPGSAAVGGADGGGRILAFNPSGADLPFGAVVELGSSSLDDATNDQQEDMALNGEVTWQVERPVHTRDALFAITLQAIPGGEFGYCRVAGIAYCRVKDWYGQGRDSAFMYARPIHANTEFAEMSDSGPFKILYRENEREEEWAAVLVDNNQAPDIYFAELYDGRQSNTLQEGARFFKMGETYLERETPIIPYANPLGLPNYGYGYITKVKDFPGRQGRNRCGEYCLISSDSRGFVRVPGNAGLRQGDCVHANYTGEGGSWSSGSVMVCQVDIPAYWNPVEDFFMPVKPLDEPSNIRAVWEDVGRIDIHDHFTSMGCRCGLVPGETGISNRRVDYFYHNDRYLYQPVFDVERTIGADGKISIGNNRYSCTLRNVTDGELVPDIWAGDIITVRVVTNYGLPDTCRIIDCPKSARPGTVILSLTDPNIDSNDRWEDITDEIMPANTADVWDVPITYYLGSDSSWMRHTDSTCVDDNNQPNGTPWLLAPARYNGNKLRAWRKKQSPLVIPRERGYTDF